MYSVLYSSVLKLFFLLILQVHTRIFLHNFQTAVILNFYIFKKYIPHKQLQVIPVFIALLENTYKKKHSQIISGYLFQIQIYNQNKTKYLGHLRELETQKSIVFL